MALTYAQKLRHPKWQKRRLEILSRDGWRCVFCHDPDINLNVDHKRYAKGREPWEYPDEDLQTLCEVCHERITGMRKRVADLIGEFNIYDLPVVVATIERMIGDAAPTIVEPAPLERRPEVTPVECDVRSGISSAAEYAAVEREKRILHRVCERDGWTQENSLRLDDIDGTLNEFWDTVGSKVDARYAA